MAEATAGSVFTGLNGGAPVGTGGDAVVLDRHPDFLPYAVQLQNQRRQDNVRLLQEKRQHEKDWDAISKSFDPAAVQMRDQAQLMDRLKLHNDELVKLKMAGNSPDDYYGKGGQRAREIAFEMKNLKKASDDNLAYRNTVAQAVAKGGDIDKGYAIDWLKKYDALPTIEEQLKFRQESSPIVPVFNPHKVTDRVTPVAFQITKETGGKTTKTSRLDKDKFEKAMLVDIESGQGLQDYEAWQQRNPEKTPEDYVDFMADYASNTFKDTYSETYDEPKPQTDASKKAATEALSYDYNNAVSTGQWGKNFAVTYAPSADGSIDNVSVKYTQGDMPYIQVADMGGQTIQFQPQKFFTKDGKLFANGFEKVKDDEGKEQIVETAVSFDDNATQFMSSMDNFNPYEFIKTKKGSGQAAAAKTIKRSDIAAKAAAAGYTTVEYEKMLKDKGVTIE